jgi:plastocyanin
MKKLILIATFLITPSAFAAHHTVIMNSISFKPKVLRISAGDTVTWVNKSMVEHSATFDDKTKFDSGLIAPKKASDTFEFTQVGRFTYHDTVQESKTMKGVVIVTGNK